MILPLDGLGLGFFEKGSKVFGLELQTNFTPN
jgi:hypothetical protein